MTDTQNHGAALQRIGTALDLDPGSDIHKEAVRAINAIKAHNQVLRAMMAHAMAKLDYRDTDGAMEALGLGLGQTPAEVLSSLEAEFDELRSREVTPTMEAIIQAVHDEAGKAHDGEGGGDIVVRVPLIEYDALCAEEAARAAE